MTRLTKVMRETITSHIIEKTRPAHEVALRAREAALAVRLLRHRYGTDVFERCRALPEGWLTVHKQIVLDYQVIFTLPRHKIATGRNCSMIYPSGELSLAEYTPLPYSACGVWPREVIGEELFEEIVALFHAKIDLEKDIGLLSQQIAATLGAFTTAERLATDWPEGYAELPAEMLAPVNAGLPAPRIADLNARIAKLREAA